MRILALDVGRNKTGVAISADYLGLVSPLKPLFCPVDNNTEEWFYALKDLLKKYPYELREIEKVVIGSWKDIEHRNSEMKRLVTQVIKVIEAKTDWEVVLIRETYTSIESRRAMKAMGVKDRKRNRTIDSYAAMFLLVDYLDLVLPREELKKKENENIRK